MNNGNLWDLLDIIVRKEKEGGTITPVQFDDLLMWGNEEFKLLVRRKYEEDQEETEAVKAIKCSEAISVDSDGEFLLADLNNTYWHHSGAYYTYSSKVRGIEVVDDKAYHKRMGSDLLEPTDELPIMLYRGVLMQFEPLRSKTVQYSYLKKPNTPVYDYFRDSNDLIYYLDPTWSIVQSGVQYNVHNALNGGGSAIYTNITHLTASSFPYNSQSVEMSWIDDDKIYVLYLILQKIGVQIELPAVLQYSLMREQKKEAND